MSKKIDRLYFKDGNPANLEYSAPIDIKKKRKIITEKIKEIKLMLQEAEEKRKITIKEINKIDFIIKMKKHFLKELEKVMELTEGVS